MSEHESGGGYASQQTTPVHALRTRALSTSQERRLMTYLDEQFLELTRHFKKRTEDTSVLRTLSDYLGAVQKLLALILQIPPVPPSAALRVAYLLRWTGDVLTSIPGYSLLPQVGNQHNVAETNGHLVANDSPSVNGSELTAASGSDTERYKASLRELLDFLDDIDCAWVATLRGQVWDPDTGQGVDLVDENNQTTSSVSQTDKARLRSLLIGGEAALEDWLNEGKFSGDNEETDVTGMLERMGILDDFDELFANTMDCLGEMRGVSGMEVV